MADSTWVPVYTGRWRELDLVQEELERLEIQVERIEVDMGNAMYEVGVTGNADLAFHTLVVPPDAYAARRQEIDDLVGVAKGSEEGDSEAMAEAEEDYDVRGCPNCSLYFHDAFLCPGCGTGLVPAVDLLEIDQLAPDRVIVVVGAPAEAAAVSARLSAAEFDAQVTSPPGWTVSAVDIGWGELNDRTSEVETILAA